MAANGKAVIVMKDELVEQIYDCRSAYEEYKKYNFSAMVRELCKIGMQALAEKAEKARQ